MKRQRKMPATTATGPVAASAATDAMIANLTRLGFSVPEARTYAALVQAQPATAYELAKTSGLARANSYNAVSGLVLKGAIQPISSQPVRYATTSPERVFPVIAERIANSSRALVAQIEEMAATSRSDFVEVWEGRQAIEDHIRELIHAARQHLHLKTRDILAAPFLDDLVAAAERGVSITVVASGEAWGALHPSLGVTIVAHEGTGSVPSDPHEVLLTLTADGDAAFVGALGDTPRGYSAPNRTLVYVIRTMILHEIYLAEIARAVGLETLAKAGVDFESLRAKFRPELHGTDVAQDP